MERQVVQLFPLCVCVCVCPLGFYARLVLAQSYRGEFLKLRFKVQVQQLKLATCHHLPPSRCWPSLSGSLRSIDLSNCFFFRVWEGDNTQSSVFNLNFLPPSHSHSDSQSQSQSHSHINDSPRHWSVSGNSRCQTPALLAPPSAATNRTAAAAKRSRCHCRRAGSWTSFHSIENLAEFFTAVIYKFWLNFLATFCQMKLNRTCCPFLLIIVLLSLSLLLFCHI